MNILLVEPDYRSKFPPLGLLRIASFHKKRGDSITFVRGNNLEYRSLSWNRIYVSSLFTYELPRTLDTIKYYMPSVSFPEDNLYVGGVGATLLPDYIRSRLKCRIIEGLLDKPGMLGFDEDPVADEIPDYSLLDTISWKYRPENAYFIRITKGCIRKCKFCAVPTLEPNFGFLQSVSEQISEIKARFGERRDLVALDNNILALENVNEVIRAIREQGFEKGAKCGNKERYVDFNQGIDARLITPEIAKSLSTICINPIRLAFDHDAIESQYRLAVSRLADVGFQEFTTYVMFNYMDTPESFYHRLNVNLELSQRLRIKVTGFPMRYIPINDINRRYVSEKWTWRQLRGIQCILNATHGIVSPNPTFFSKAFGASEEEFKEIVSMPDDYIIYRAKYNNQADEWRSLYRCLSESEKCEFHSILYNLKNSRVKSKIIQENTQFFSLLSHYYP